MQRALLVFLPALTVLGACASENSVMVQTRRLSTDQATFDAGQVAINDRETLVHDVTHVCADCDATWTAG